MDKNKFLRLKFLVLIVIFSFNACTGQQTIFTVKAPEANVWVVLNASNGAIKYRFLKEGKELIGESEIAIIPNATALKVVGSSVNSKHETWKPVWGQFSEITDEYAELILEVLIEDVKAKLYVRVFNEGIGLRYELEEYKEDTEVDFYCEYNLNNKDVLYSPNSENSPLGPITVEELKKGEKQSRLMTPLVIEKFDHKHLSLLESDLYSAPEFGVIEFNFNKEKNRLTSSNKTKLKGGGTKTPWRVILVNDAVGDLVTNTVPLNLATPKVLEDVSWVKPGKTLWDWRVHGYTTEDEFTYGINNESYIRFIDFAAEKSIEYFLIDANWYTKVTKGHFEISDKLDIEKVATHAKEKGVKLILYYDRHKGDYGDEALFPYFESLGMSGIKYGFMGHNVFFTSDAIQKSADNHLLINFHDSPVPFTGIERTLPNAITKEYCHAQQDSRRAFTPETFIKMALINAIQGPLDMNNGNFSLVDINNGNREKGPIKQHSYFSTVASEAARTLIIYSGLVCLPDAPEAYAEKADLFEFIQKMPVGKWDESTVLQAKMGAYISTARRYKEEWFIGSVTNEEERTLDINLDFLKEGQQYEITYYEDTSETHGKTNPEAYQIRKGKVKKGSIIKAKMAVGGGHCMWIKPELK